jgi:hypothetical protein
VKTLVLVLLLTGCSFEQTGLPIAARNDAASPPDDVRRADARDDARPDAHLDSRWPDATPDAFACTTHAQCAAMKPGDCCVMPGPSGYCAHGIIIADACVVQ